MKMSEAIRLGAMLRPQAFGVAWKADGGSCALGAALEAIGQPTVYYSRVLDHWPAMCLAYANNPVTEERLMLWSVVRQLNDDQRWTRQQIADWVEAREPQEQVAPEPECDKEECVI